MKYVIGGVLLISMSIIIALEIKSIIKEIKERKKKELNEKEIEEIMEKERIENNEKTN